MTWYIKDKKCGGKMRVTHLTSLGKMICRTRNAKTEKYIKEKKLFKEIKESFGEKDNQSSKCW